MRELLDAYARNREHPTTFQIPDAAEVHDLKPGDFVKIGFLLMPGEVGPEFGNIDCERMWVVVTDPTARPMQGTLNNDPVFVRLVCGAPVEFEPKHILSILSGRRH